MCFAGPLPPSHTLLAVELQRLFLSVDCKIKDEIIKLKLKLVLIKLGFFKVFKLVPMVNNTLCCY